MPEFNVRLFGAFRNLQDDPMLRLDLAADRCTVADLRSRLERAFRELAPGSFDAVGLLAKAAIANEKSILLDEATIAQGDNLALLPPVSGG